MRLMMLFSLVTFFVSIPLSSIAAQQTACLGQDKVLHDCASSVQPFDQEIAARHFSQATFCQAADLTHYVIVRDFDSNQATLPIKSIAVKAGMVYRFNLDDLAFQMIVNSVDKTPINSRLIVSYTKDYMPSTSFECR
jgi:hypothetical protein